MNMSGAVNWVQDHPTESIVLGLAGTLGVLWLLGFFSGGGSSSESSGGSANLAAAYYAAEAQQAVIGGQIQMTQIAANASTAQAAGNASAAVAINDAQTRSAVTINQQNADASALLGSYGLQAALSGDQLAATLGNYGYLSTRSNNELAATMGNYGLLSALSYNEQATARNAADNQTAMTLGNYNLLATRSNNETTIATNAANNASAFQIAHDNNIAMESALMLGTIIPHELTLTGGAGATYDMPGGQGSYSITGKAPSAPAPPDTATQSLLAQLGSTVAGISQQIADFFTTPPAAPHQLTGAEAAASLGPTSGLFQGHNNALMDIQQALIRGIPIGAGSWAQAGIPRIPGF